jgi:predicted enzyme related to lactoylglutathione lyase
MNRPLHFEIPSDDTQSLARFYGGIVGWRIDSLDFPEGYWPADTGPDGTPGLHGGSTLRHLPQGFIDAISVESVDDTRAEVGSGGAGVQEHHEIPGVDSYSYCTDLGGTGSAFSSRPRARRRDGVPAGRRGPAPRGAAPPYAGE